MTSLHAKRGPSDDRAPVAPADVRYIKLGPSGAWVDRCLDESALELGHNGVPFELTSAGDWDAVRTHFLALGATLSKASDFTRELRDFHTLPETALWITTARGRLWWAFADGAVQPVSGEGRGSRLRRVRGQWRSTDVEGVPLTLDTLSTRLTKISAYRQTLCRVEATDYLLRRINAQPEPVVAAALSAREGLLETVGRMIAGLHWRDFEVLTDLIFAGGGWRRVSGVGGSDQADSDLVLEQATTGERAMVQVKSSADQAVIEDYAARFEQGDWDRCFIVCHSPRGRLNPPAMGRFHLWHGKTLADQAVRAGLLDWLIAKCR